MNDQPRSPRRMRELSKFRASYYLGLTIEADPKSNPPKLAIDGHKVDIEKQGEEFVYSAGGLRATTLVALSREIIDVLWNRKRRQKIRNEHLAELKKGRASWTKWRRDHFELRPLLFGADLRGANLSGFNLCNANLINADLRNATLIGANFHEANLGGAKLNDANLRAANFCRTDLYETDFSGTRTDLRGANLQGTQLARTNLSGARLSECTIYGLSAWNLKLQAARQKNLSILYPVKQAEDEWDNGEFVVQDLEVAQFVFLLLDNSRINNFFNTMTSKAVVIMGRFVPAKRKAILEGLRRDLRKHGFLPIVFDFDKPKDRDLTETIKTLVGLCKFAIVDITNPRSSPLELEATVKDYQVPFVPIIQKGEKPFSMFNDLRKYKWMLGTLTYQSAATLSLVTKPLIIDRAVKACEQIRNLTTGRGHREWSDEEFLASTRQNATSLRYTIPGSSDS